MIIERENTFSQEDKAAFEAICEKYREHIYRILLDDVFAFCELHSGLVINALTPKELEANLQMYI